MELEGRRRVEPSINLSALIDIVFILVIFVVLAANFQHLKGLDVDLPEAEAKEAVGTEEALVVTVPVEGPVQVNDKAVDLHALQDMLTHLRRDYKSLILRSDGEAAFERAVQVLAKARAAGFDAVSIATVLPKATP